MLTKVCTVCGVEKSVDEYQNKKDGKYGVMAQCKACCKQYKSQYYQANKEAIYERQKAYEQANKEAIAERQKAWYQKNKEAVAERGMVYRQANKETIAERNRVHRKVYCQANPHIFNALNAKRRASRLRATPAWADKEHIGSLYHIASINREAGYDLHVDHIVPLQSDLVCGLHCEANLQLLPASVNISKGNRYWPDMW